MLTHKEQQILDYINSYWLRKGTMPTIAEMAKGLEMSSHGTLHRYISALVEKGKLKKGEQGTARNLELVEYPEAVLPLIGTIAAGQPIEAIPGMDTLNITELFLGEGRYALRVKGDSMINVGVFDGDWVIIQEQNTANNGNIVVALIDNQEATLKRFYKRNGDKIELMPENDDMEPMLFDAHRVKIQGILQRSIRNFVSSRL